MTCFLNRVLFWAAALAGSFFAMVTFADPLSLIIVLNGAFVGSMVAITIAYYKLMWGALMGLGEYTRVRQMTIGFALAWAAIALSAINSVYLRSMGTEIPPTALTAGTRYLAIVAAILQVTAPDFGLGPFHGRDRRVLWTGAVLGVMAAGVTIYAQSASLQF